MKLAMTVKLDTQEEMKLKEAQKVLNALCDTIQRNGGCGDICPLFKNSKKDTTCYGEDFDIITEKLCQP